MKETARERLHKEQAAPREHPAKEHKRSSVYAHAMYKMAYRPMLWAALYFIWYIVTELAKPILLLFIIRSIEDDTVIGVYLCIILGFLIVTGSLCNMNNQLIAYRTGMKLRAATIGLLYQKMMSLSVAESSTGGEQGEQDVSNLMSNDTQKFLDALPMLHMVWGAPLLILVSTGQLVYILGWSGLAGVGILFTLIPLVRLAMVVEQRTRREHLPATDRRAKLCTEAIQAIRILKCNGWDDQYLQNILKARREEFKSMIIELGIVVVRIATIIAVPNVATSITFLVYTLPSGNILQPADAFAALAVFSVLRFPILHLSDVIGFVVQLNVALERLGVYLSPLAGPSGKSLDNGEASPKSTPSEMARRSKDLASPNGNGNGEYADAAKANGKVVCEQGAVAIAPCAQFYWRGPNGGDGFTVSIGNREVYIQRGQLVVVMGPVGCGKSTFMQGLLRETYRRMEGSKQDAVDELPKDGYCECVSNIHENFGKVAYVAQQPWILNGTVRDNILLLGAVEGSEERYQESLDASALYPDLAQLPNGDGTLIGERGVTLSGGQKQRVSLARAAFSKPDLIILDDPLAALDMQTSQTVFDLLIGPGSMLGNSQCTRILATNSASFARFADQIILLHRGDVSFAGSLEDLRCAAQETATSMVPDGTTTGYQSARSLEEAADNGNHTDDPLHAVSLLAAEVLSTMSRDNSLSKLAQDDDDDETVTDTKYSKQPATEATCTETLSKAADITAVNDDSERRNMSIPYAKKLTLSKAQGDTLTEEEREQGAIGFSTIKGYVKNGGGLVWVTSALIGFLLERIGYVGSDLWLAAWTTAATQEPGGIYSVFNLPEIESSSDTTFYSIGYIIFGLLTALGAAFRTCIMMAGGFFAAKNIFATLAEAVLNSPAVFFDVTPVGRIINRFLFDTDIIDYSLVVKTLQMVASVFWMLSGLIVILASVWQMIFAIVPALVVYFYVQGRYRRSSAQVQRLESVSRGPLQSHFQESIAGASTIRAYDQLDFFVKQLYNKIDVASATFRAFATLGRWLAFRLDTIGAVISTATGIASWALRDSMNPSIAGLAITWTFNITTTLMFYVQGATEFEAKAVSVERNLEYGKLPREGEKVTKYDKEQQLVGKMWPPRGEVSFKNVWMRYRDQLPFALRGFSAEIGAGQHVGICGRTGAGKSTISVILFRLRECHSGQVLIDGTDLAKMGLTTLRGGHLCIIPQDPVLFSGTLRRNLDPFGAYDDKDLWSALRQVQMEPKIQGSDLGLDSPVTAGGENFSVGERQLLCFARALLRKPRVLLLDEATASVDSVTDELIQRTVREAFHNVTLLTIAHRLHTIMDGDRILMMSKGQLIEEGSPHQLLTKDGSALRDLVLSHGEDELARLQVIAAEASELRNRRSQALRRAYDAAEFGGVSTG